MIAQANLVPEIKKVGPAELPDRVSELVGKWVSRALASVSPAVGREIEAVIESADRIDLVLAFTRWTGIRQLLPSPVVQSVRSSYCAHLHPFCAAHRASADR